MLKRQDFTGVSVVTGVNYLMIKHLSLVAIGLLCLGAPSSFAQNGRSPLGWDGSLNSAMALSMFYGEHAPVQTAIGQMGAGPMNVFPATLVSSVAASRPAPRSAGPDLSKDSPEQEVAAVRKDPIYYGGEIGTFYGHSSGKFGGDDFGSYLVGTVGTDKFQITAGASYEESNFKLPRRFR